MAGSGAVPWYRARWTVNAITQRMSDAGHIITHVSDTARWTALYRATESPRADALFSDPLAERLAVEQGRAIVAKAPVSSRNGWWLISRTKIIDDAIAEGIADGCDRVLNLAAGLDTRPYRLDLPADFPWIEADLPQLLAEKTQLLADQRRAVQIRTRQRVGLLRRPGLARARSGIAVHGRKPVPPLADIHVAGRLGAAAECTAPRPQSLECDCHPDPVSPAND